MVKTIANQPTDFRILEEKCKNLEHQCAKYVRTLEVTNKNLAREITRHRRTAQKFKESESRFRTFFHNAPFGAAISDFNGRIVIANRTLSHILGYDAHKLVNMCFPDVTFPDDAGKDGHLFNRLIERKISHYTSEKRFRRKDGEVVWGNLAVTMISGEVDESDMIISMVEDITTRKKADEEIKKSRNELENIVSERTQEIRLLKDRLQAENIILKQELAASQAYGTIIGKSNPIKTVISQIELVSPTQSNVLIYGESGTGKELVAREIHKHSSRKDKPLIKVNCATIPKDLYESEFFGHVKGAFTGAVKDRIGRFETADGGTIFLDEVGEIPLDLQSKLLRILQEGEYERLGEDRTRKVDVRLIAATNKDLIKEVRSKRFRDDLFYRLNVFPITIAPLRERKEDIQLLAMHFVENLTKKLNVPCPRLTKANIMDLQSYDWPGNVRELENAIERAMILSRSRSLNFNLIKENFNSIARKPDIDPKADDTSQEILTNDDLKTFERQNTIRALEHCKWKLYGNNGAAGLLGIKPTTLIERMKRMRIQKPQHKI